MEVSPVYIQLTRQDGSFVQIPYSVLINARILSGGPTPGSHLYYEHGGYDAVRESPEKIDMAIAAYTAGALSKVESPRRPTEPIGENLDFIRAVALVWENPELRCLVSHEWPVIDGILHRYMSINRHHPDPIQVGNFQIDTKSGHWMGGPNGDRVLGLWDVYYLPEDHVFITKE